MDIKNTLLFVVALLDIFLAVLVYFHRIRGGATHRVFTYFVIASVLWVLAMIGFRMTTEEPLISLSLRILYFFALGIPPLFLYFVLLFTDVRSKVVKSAPYLLAALFSIMGILVFWTDKIVVSALNVTGLEKEITFGSLYYSYIAYFFSIFGTAFYALFKKYFQTNVRSTKLKIFSITIGVLVAAISGMTTNLVLPWLGYFNLNWFGNFTVVIAVAFLFYAVVEQKLFELKLITTEIFVFGIIVTLIADLFFVNSVAEVIVKSIVLTLVSVLSFVFTKSVYREIELRQRTERLAGDLERANVRLQELDRQKSEFVSIASHQLKSPLTAIRGYASMVVDGSFGKVPAKVIEAVGRIEKSSGSMVDVIEDFLNITRIEQGRMKYDFVPNDLRDIVTEIAGELEPTIKASGLEFKVHIPKEPMRVVVDKGKIRQVILNLIDNAVKYTPKGFVNVTLARTDGHVVFSVKDSGIGIPKEFVVHLFGKFNRADNSKKIQANGSGIGLYLAKEILKAHTGRIWVESEGDGKGSTFFVELPYSHYG